MVADGAKLAVAVVRLLVISCLHHSRRPHVRQRHRYSFSSKDDLDMSDEECLWEVQVHAPMQTNSAVTLQQQ